MQRQRSAESEQWLQKRKYDYHEKPNWHMDDEHTQEQRADNSEHHHDGRQVNPVSTKATDELPQQSDETHNVRVLSETNNLPVTNGSIMEAAMGDADDEKTDHDDDQSSQQQFPQQQQHEQPQQQQQQQQRQQQPADIQYTDVTLHVTRYEPPQQQQQQTNEPVFNRMVNAYSGAGAQPPTSIYKTTTNPVSPQYRYGDDDDAKTPVDSKQLFRTTSSSSSSAAAGNNSAANVGSNATGSSGISSWSSATPASRASGTTNNKMAEYAKLIREQYLNSA